MGSYIITKNAKGKYHFNLVASNKEVILSSQMYMARKGAVKGIKSVAKNAPIAPVVNLTAKNVKPEGNPKFEIFQGKDEKYYFRLIAKNAQTIGSSEGYNTLSSCQSGIKSVKKNAASEIEKPAPVAKKEVKKPTKKSATKKK